MIQGKVWGRTELVESNQCFELHRIQIREGGTCSRHYHQTKFNGFYVISGHLLIEIWTDRGIDELEMREGDWTKIPPGKFHRFKALTDVEALEIYWSEFDPTDIVRDTSSLGSA